MTKQEVKNKINNLSEQDAEKVDRYIKALRKPKSLPKKRLTSINMGGKLDVKDIRKLAYE